MKKPTVFIHTNSQQILGAMAAKYSFQKNSKSSHLFNVELINYDDYPILKSFDNRKYLRKGQLATWHSEDLQSFSVLRFLPPQLMNYQGRAVVVDPDVFAVGDIYDLLSMDMQGKAICARLYTGRKTDFASSVMLLDCEKLRHWNWDQEIVNLFEQKFDYGDWIFLRREKLDSIGVLDKSWNDLDVLDSKTKLLHTTERLTQPWKYGLPIDFNQNLPKVPMSGDIRWRPLNLRERMRSWLRGGQTIYGPGGTYQKHPEINVEVFIIKLIKDCFEAGVFDKEFIKNEIKRSNVRKDLVEILEARGNL